MIVFWEYDQKRCVIWRKSALWKSNLFSICWMRWAGIPAYDVQRANQLYDIGTIIRLCGEKIMRDILVHIAEGKVTAIINLDISMPLTVTNTPTYPAICCDVAFDGRVFHHLAKCTAALQDWFWLDNLQLKLYKPDVAFFGHKSGSRNHHRQHSWQLLAVASPCSVG